jgi:hypothetical protein
VTSALIMLAAAVAIGVNLLLDLAEHLHRRRAERLERLGVRGGRR